MTPDYLGKLFSFFDVRTRWQIGGLLCLMFLGAGLEMLSLALFVPLFQIAVDPDRLTTIPILSDLLVRVGIHNADHAIVFLGIGLLVLYGIKNLALFGLLWLQNLFVQVKQSQFADSLLRTYLTRPYAAHLRQNSAEISRNVLFSSTQVFANGLLGLLVMVMEGLIMAAVITVLLAVEPVGALIAAIILGVSMTALYWVTRRRVTAWGGELENLKSGMIQAVNEGLGAFKEVKLMGREDHVLDRFSRPNMGSARYRAWLALVVQVPRLVGEVAILASIFVVVAYMIATEGRPVAEAIPVLAIFAAGAMRILPSANRLVGGANHIRRSLVAVDNLYRDIQAIGPVETQPSAAADFAFSGDIDIQNLSFRYESRDDPSLVDVSLKIAKGETVALVGPSGAGKTTLADMIMGLHVPDSGKISVGGVDIRNNLRGWRSLFGYVPQTIAIMDDSLRRNIAFALPDHEIDEERVMAACGLAQLSDVIETLPEGLDSKVGDNGIRLSGGQRQRTGIARALYSDPEILVLDEATSALDNETENEFRRAIESLRGIKTLIIIAHRLSTVRTADRIFLMNDGRVVDSGSFEDLYGRNESFRRNVDLDGGPATMEAAATRLKAETS